MLMFLTVYDEQQTIYLMKIIAIREKIMLASDHNSLIY